MSANGKVIPPDGGRKIPVGPNELLVKAGPETGHTLVGVFQSTLPPGGGFPFPHVHDEYEEVFYVIEGEIEYRLGDSWTTASAGTTICVPPGAVHCFRNSTQETARHLVVHAPAVALEMIEEIGKNPPDKWEAVLAKGHSRLVEG